MSFETPAPANRLNNIQSLRGIAALLVVFSHLLVIESKYSPDQFLGSWMSFGQVGVDLFFVISGFIMVHVAMKMRRGTGSALEFLFARLTRVYPLYWLVSAALLLVWLARPDMVFSSFKTDPNIIKSFLLYPDSRDPLLAVGWTLVHEIGFYLVFALALLLKPKWLLPFLLLWALVLGGGQYLGLGTNPLLKLLFSPLSYEFLGGALAGWAFHKYKAKFALTILIAGLVLWAVSLYLLISAEHSMIASAAGRAIHFSIPAIFTVYGLAGIETNLPKYTQTLGDWSYALYLTHILTLTLFGRFWQAFSSHSTHDNKWDNIPALIIMTIASILVAGLTYRLAEKPMLMGAKALRRRLFFRRVD
ncbi:MAG: acyltransferase [Robiginitomaculum sp.]|nr:acyltransferase [Robiginitomaculum sp.]